MKTYTIYYITQSTTIIVCNVKALTISDAMQRIENITKIEWYALLHMRFDTKECADLYEKRLEFSYTSLPELI